MIVSGEHPPQLCKNKKRHQALKIMSVLFDQLWWIFLPGLENSPGTRSEKNLNLSLTFFFNKDKTVLATKITKQKKCINVKCKQKKKKR